jgi:hypothetical protein
MQPHEARTEWIVISEGPTFVSENSKFAVSSPGCTTASFSMASNTIFVLAALRTISRWKLGVVERPLFVATGNLLGTGGGVVSGWNEGWGAAR